MDSISWSLSAIDKIFSTRSRGSGEPRYPDGSMPAGYVINSWDQWRLVCLSVLSVADIEDLFLFGLNLTGFLLIGLGVALVYRKILKVVVEKKASTLLSVEIMEHFKKLGDEFLALQLAATQSEGKVSDLTGRAGDSHKKLDYIMGQSAEVFRQIAELRKKVDELWDHRHNCRGGADKLRTSY